MRLDLGLKLFANKTSCLSTMLFHSWGSYVEESCYGNYRIEPTIGIEMCMKNKQCSEYHETQRRSELFSEKFTLTAEFPILLLSSFSVTWNIIPVTKLGPRPILFSYFL